jgi:hypothetical protein
MKLVISIEVEICNFQNSFGTVQFCQRNKSCEIQASIIDGCATSPSLPRDLSAAAATPMDYKWIFFLRYRIGGSKAERPYKESKNDKKVLHRSDGNHCSVEAGAHRNLVPIGGFRVPRMDGSQLPYLISYWLSR